MSRDWKQVYRDYVTYSGQMNRFIEPLVIEEGANNYILKKLRPQAQDIQIYKNIVIPPIPKNPLPAVFFSDDVVQNNFNDLLRRYHDITSRVVDQRVEIGILRVYISIAGSVPDA